LVCRFGASALLLDSRRIVIVGGFRHDGIVPRADEVLILDTLGPGLEILAHYCLASPERPSNIPRPLLVGTSTSLADSGQIVLMGGGATVSISKFRYFPLPDPPKRRVGGEIIGRFLLCS
jgi:tRNA wybutosine-synthesizing protein 4